MAEKKLSKMNQSEHEKRYKGEGRVAFLAHLGTIREQIELGWPMKAVFDNHKHVLDIQYMQFQRYVNQYVKGNERKLKPVRKKVEKSASFPQNRSTNIQSVEIRQFIPGPKNPDLRDIF